MELKINMLIPIDQDGTPVVPVSLFSWIKRARRKRLVIDLGDNIVIEQWDDAIYFKTKTEFKNSEFLRYDVPQDMLCYFNDNEPIEIKTVKQLEELYRKHFIEYNLKYGFAIHNFS